MQAVWRRGGGYSTFHSEMQKSGKEKKPSNSKYGYHRSKGKNERPTIQK